MRIWLTKTCAGPEGSFLGQREYAVPGEMPEGLAKALVAGGAAEWREAPPQAPAVEAAVAEPAEENAAERTTAPKSRRGRSKRSAG